MLGSLSGRINTFLLALVVLMAASIIAIVATRAGADPLDPPAPPSAGSRCMAPPARFEPAAIALEVPPSSLVCASPHRVGQMFIARSSARIILAPTDAEARETRPASVRVR